MQREITKIEKIGKPHYSAKKMLGNSSRPRLANTSINKQMARISTGALTMQHMACDIGTNQTKSIAMCSNENTKSRTQLILLNLQLMVSTIKKHKKMIMKVKTKSHGNYQNQNFMVQASIFLHLNKQKQACSNESVLYKDRFDQPPYLQPFRDPSGIAGYLSHGRGGTTIYLGHRWTLFNCYAALMDKS